MENKEYSQWIVELKKRVCNSQIKAAIRVNTELIRLYWSIGHDIAERRFEKNFEGNFYRQLSNDLQRLFPNVKGFSERNIHYMRAMYVIFSQLDDELPQAVAVTESSNYELPQVVAVAPNGQNSSLPQRLSARGERVGVVRIVGRVGARGIFRPHTEGTETQSFLGHRGELTLAEIAQSN
ncbi:MAG: hypothetical protein II951_02305 [Bacteroidales bacterium]|nr:hypothetical protein [Bacteroidales bacterium]